MSYYNTTGMTGLELRKEVMNARTMDEKIRLIYTGTRQKWTPWDVHGMLTRAESIQAREQKRIETLVDIISVRRSINTLTKENHLKMLAETKVGARGKPEHYWIVNPAKYPTPQQAAQGGLFNSI